MAEKVTAGPVSSLNGVREAVCVHTKKIYSSCRDKDCIEALRFYPTESAQEVLASAQGIRGGSAELLYTFVDVEPVNFNRGFYTVDMRFYYKITLQALSGSTRYTEVVGLATFGKRVILCGGESGPKIFSSEPVADELDVQLDAVRPGLFGLAEGEHGVLRVFPAVTSVCKNSHLVCFLLLLCPFRKCLNFF